MTNQDIGSRSVVSKRNDQTIKFQPITATKATIRLYVLTIEKVGLSHESKVAFKRSLSPRPNTVHMSACHIVIWQLWPYMWHSYDMTLRQFSYLSSSFLFDKRHRPCHWIFSKFLFFLFSVLLSQRIGKRNKDILWNSRLTSNFIFTQVLQNLQKQIIDRMILPTFPFRILAIKKFYIEKYFKSIHFIREGIR